MLHKLGEMVLYEITVTSHYSETCSIAKSATTQWQNKSPWRKLMWAVILLPCLPPILIKILNTAGAPERSCVNKC